MQISASIAPGAHFSSIGGQHRFKRPGTGQPPRTCPRAEAAGVDSLRRQFSRSLFVLLGLVGLILAIACANIAKVIFPIYYSSP
jgi:hypothetical protein